MRDDITIMPADSSLAKLRMDQATKRLASTDWQPLAAISCGGVLVRHSVTGRLAEHFGTHIGSVNERKAKAALAEVGA